MTARPLTHRYLHLIPALVLTAGLAFPASAQTVITPDKNKYSPAEDVKIGQEAAREARQQLPMLNDGTVDEYLEDVGQRLVNAIPQQYRHNEFRYSFDVVNMKEINAFALPGGPMFVNRGMIEASRNEGEMAGVMAHEIAHVALRHGTAQATKGQKFQIGAIAGQILGAIVGGTAGSVIAQGSQIGLGTYFMKYGREYERQADLLGAQIMARAGYDPQHMAAMFETIEREGGARGGPEWMSSHPNPGNRRQAILNEARSLRVEGDAGNQRAFNNIRGRLNSMSPAWSAEEVARAQSGRGRVGDDVPERTSRGRVAVEPPSSQYRTRVVGDFLRLNVPSNWEEIRGSNSITFAPEGGLFRAQNGQTTFTHGLEIGVVDSESHDLQRGTEELLDAFARANPQLRRESVRRENISGRQGLTTTMSNVSEVTGDTELVVVSTVQMRDGRLLYLVGVAPSREANQYNRVFAQVRRTAQLNDQGRTR